MRYVQAFKNIRYLYWKWAKCCIVKWENGLIKVIDRVEENIRTINPPHAENYPYEPYEFKDMDEVLSYVERARNETIDSL